MSPELDPYAPPRLEGPVSQSSPASVGAALVVSVHFESERRALRRSPRLFGPGTVSLEPWGLTLSGQTPSMKGRALKVLSVITIVVAVGVGIAISVAFELEDIFWLVIAGPGLVVGLLMWVAGGRMQTPLSLSLQWNEIRSVYGYGNGLRLQTTLGDLMVFPERRTPYWAAHQAALQQLASVIHQRAWGGQTGGR